MNRLLELISLHVNNFENTTVPPQFIKDAATKVHLAPDHTGSKYRYRASSIGKPWMLQILERWYGGGKPAINVVSASRMSFGNLSQEIAANALRLSGLDVQQEVELEHLGVGGHADMVVTAGTHAVVLECKCMASYICRSFKQTPNDDYGYVSQLSLYAEAVAASGKYTSVTQAFLLHNRDTCDFTLVPLTDGARASKLQRLAKALDAVSQVEDYNVGQLLSFIPVPPLQQNGKLLPSLKGSRWAKVLYNHVKGDVWSPRELSTIDAVLRSIPQQREDGATLSNTQSTPLGKLL